MELWRWRGESWRGGVQAGEEICCPSVLNATSLSCNRGVCAPKAPSTLPCTTAPEQNNKEERAVDTRAVEDVGENEEGGEMDGG